MIIYNSRHYQALDLALFHKLTSGDPESFVSQFFVLLAHVMKHSSNCLNAIGALIGSSYGELVEDPQSRGVFIRLADEAIRVLGATREYKSFDSGLHYVESSLIPIVVPKARAHRSSMLQDIEAGRKTEIDYLNGAVLKMGRSCGIDTPINETVLSLIQAMERRAPSRLRHLR